MDNLGIDDKTIENLNLIDMAAWDCGTSWLGLFICRPLRPYLHLVVLDNATSFPLVEL